MKKGIVETHNPYKKGGPYLGPEKCDGEINDGLEMNYQVAHPIPSHLGPSDVKPRQTKSQKKFKKKLNVVLAKKKSGKKRTKIFIRDERALGKLMDND